MDAPQRVIVVANEPRRATESNIWLTRVLPFFSPLGFEPEVLFFFQEEGYGYVGEALRLAGIRCHYRRRRETEHNIREILELVQNRGAKTLIAGGNLSAYYATPWLHEAGIPVVALLSAEDAYHEEIYETFLARKGRFQVDAGVAVSNYLSGLIETAGLPATCCPFGVPQSRLVAEFSASPFRVLCLGDFCGETDPAAQLLDLAGPLIEAGQNLELAITGKGIERAELQEVIASEEFEGRLRVVRSVAPSRVQMEMAKYQALLVLSNAEGAATTLLEAMSVGLVPVVLPGAGRLDELLGDEAPRILVNDGVEAVRRLEELSHDESGWKRRSLAARDQARERYSLEGSAGQWAAFLQGLPGQSGNPAAIVLPAPETIELPPPRENSPHLVKADLRLPGRPKDDFQLMPPCLLEHSEYYWHRRSLLRALEQNLSLFEGKLLDLSAGRMPLRTWLLTRARGVTDYLAGAMEGERFAAQADFFWEGQHLPFADASVASVLAADLPGNCPDPEQALREIRRVLKPGGRVFLTASYLLPFEPGAGEVPRFTAHGLKALLEKAGFCGIGVAALSGWHGSLAQMMGLWLKRAPMDEEKRNRLGTKLWSLYEELVEEDLPSPDFENDDAIASAWSGAAFVPDAPDPEPEAGDQAELTLDALQAELSRVSSAESAMHLALAHSGGSPEVEEFVFIAARKAATLDRNCGPAYLLMGRCLLDRGRREDAYFCFKEADRVGALDESERQILTELEAGPTWESDSVQAYRSRISLAQPDQVERTWRILVLKGLGARPADEEDARALTELSDGLLSRGHSVLELAADEMDADTLDLKVDCFAPEVCLLDNLGARGMADLASLLSRKIPVLHWLAEPDPGFPVEATPRSPLYCMAGCSKWTIDCLKEKGYAPGRFAWMPPGAKVCDYYRLMLPEMDRLRICYAGPMIGAKGPHLLLAAMSILQELKIPFRCEFAGAFKDARYEAHFLNVMKQKELGDTVRLLGSCSGEALAALYARSNVFVMPGIQDEPFGKRQIEAQAAGLAVIRSGLGGYRDILTDEVNGLLSRTDDAEDIARQLYILHEDKALWQSIAVQGQADAFRYSLEASIRAVVAILATL